MGDDMADEAGLCSGLVLFKMLEEEWWKMLIG